MTLGIEMDEEGQEVGMAKQQWILEVIIYLD